MSRDSREKLDELVKSYRQEFDQNKNPNVFSEWSYRAGFDAAMELMKPHMDKLRSDVVWAKDIIKDENGKQEDGIKNPFRKPLEFIVAKVEALDRLTSHGAKP